MTGYLYDGDCVVAEFDAQGKVRAQYIHGPGLGADVGSLICAQTLGADGAASERYYSHNWRGDTIGITDESGASLARYRYGAFGELIAGDGGIANNILFSGKRYDSASGLYYFGARYYDASSGRFISRDPMGYIDGPNDYILAMNNPLLWIDPYGLWKRQAWNTVVNAIDYVSGVSSVNAMSIFNPLSENPLGTVDPIPEFKMPDKWITPFPEIKIQDIRDPNPGPQAPLDDINPNPGPQKPLHNITYFPTPQPWDDGILRKGNTPPHNENAKGDSIGTIYVDGQGNAIVTPKGGTITGSKDGTFIQVRDSKGNATGVRIDGPHISHSDSRAKERHGHIPGLTNNDGTPWLPVKGQ